MRNRGLAQLMAVAVYAGMIAAAAAEEVPVTAARIVAVGLPGAGAVAQIGVFHPGGPIHDKPEFAAYTAPGKVLDPNRVLVTSSSNFGATKARSGEPGGAALSIDAAGGSPIVIPADFAAGGDQTTAVDGKVQLFTVQSPAFINGVNAPKAVTARLPSVSDPLGISINNGFGRLWFSNAPAGSAGAGTESVLDPTGQPLAGAPSRLAGGVFAGDQTNRNPQFIRGGLRSGAIASVLLGMSSDGSKRAVFAVLTADGAVSQAHTELNVDGLAPAGTISAIVLPAPDAAATTSVTRAGMVFNWVPDRIIYVSDPSRSAIVALTLADDGKIFSVEKTRRIELPELDVPVGLAPAVQKIANPAFSSNTTLAGASDIYAVSRGNGTVVRLTQDGKMVAVRRVSIGGEPVGSDRLNGIAVSVDAQHIWLTVSGALPGFANSPGALVEIPAFGAGHAAEARPPPAAQKELAQRGAVLFETPFGIAEGLGPLYNEKSCNACHDSPRLGGMGPEGLGLHMRVGKMVNGSYDPLEGRGGPVARRHSIAELGVNCRLVAGMPAEADVVSLRNAPSLFGAGLIDGIPDAIILAAATAERSGGTTIAGRAHMVRGVDDGDWHVGRFGWKANTAALRQVVAHSLRNEIGITNPLAPSDLVAMAPGCDVRPDPNDDGAVLSALYAFVATLAPPSVHTAGQASEGAALFTAAGCASCHIPELQGAQGMVPLYSDLLLHDMGSTLDDGVVQGQARGTDWRTTPLWGLGERVRFLHDGRATTLRAAIIAHDGEAAPAAKTFLDLPPQQQMQLLSFLRLL